MSRLPITVVSLLNSVLLLPPMTTLEPSPHGYVPVGTIPVTEEPEGPRMLPLPEYLRKKENKKAPHPESKKKDKENNNHTQKKERQKEQLKNPVPHL